MLGYTRFVGLHGKFGGRVGGAADRCSGEERDSPLMPKSTFVPLFNLLFLRNKCYKQLTLTFLTH